MTLKEIIYYMFRIFKWKLGERSPVIAIIKLTYRCNLKCFHCVWKKLPKTGEAESEKWKEIFLNLFKKGIRIIVFEGGEPTLRKDLEDLILLAKKIGFKVVLVTNGTNPLINYDPDLIIVSVDGTAEFHDKIRGKGSFLKLTQNLINVKIRKLSLTTLNKTNKTCVAKMIEEISPFFDGFGFNIMYPYNKKHESIMLTKTEIKEIYKDISRLSDKFEIVNSPGMISDVEWKCTPWMSILCEPNGNWQIQNECFIGITDTEIDCSKCHLGCYRGFSQLAKGDLNSWYLLNKHLFG